MELVLTPTSETGKRNKRSLKAAVQLQAMAARHPSPLKRAFTLIELIVVLAIIALITSLALPNFTAYYDAERLRSFSRRVIACINYAHQYAVSRRCITALSLDERDRVVQVLVPREYALSDDAEFDSGNVQSESASKVTIGTNTYELPSELAMLLSDRQVEFSPDGFVPAREKRFGSVKIPEGIEVAILDAEGSSKLNYILFRHDGTATGAKVNVRGWRGFQIAIVIDAVSSKVSVEWQEESKR